MNLINTIFYAVLFLLIYNEKSEVIPYLGKSHGRKPYGNIHFSNHEKDSMRERFPQVLAFSTCLWTRRLGVHEQKWWGKDSDCCLLWTKMRSFWRQLVKAAEDESESFPLTGAPVVLSPVRFHLVSLAQGEYGGKKEALCPSSSPLDYLQPPW